MLTVEATSQATSADAVVLLHFVYQSDAHAASIPRRGSACAHSAAGSTAAAAHRPNCGTPLVAEAMPLTLHYANLPGRAETARLLLTLGGVEFVVSLQLRCTAWL